MSILSKKTMGGGFMDVIRCDEPSYLIWKWHPEGTKEGDNRRENAIRWGSSLRVKDGAAAVFVYKQDDGTMQDIIIGPYDGIIETNNFPVLSRIVGLAYAGESPFQAEVYFINLANVNQINFGVPYFDVFDYENKEYSVPVAVRGTLTFMIKDPEEFIKLHRLETFDFETFKGQVKNALIKYVKGIVANIPENREMPVLAIERTVLETNEEIEEYVVPRFEQEFGVLVSSIDISDIDIDKTSDEYKQLLSITKDIKTETLRVEKEVKLKNIRDMQNLDVIEREQRIKADVEEDKYARHMQTQSSNIAAYQTEKAAEVGVATAKGMGEMGSNGGMSMNGGDMNPTSMMMGMTIGGAMGQQLAKTMNDTLSGVNGNPAPNIPTPPPIPKTVYNVVINDESAGPFDISTLKNMALSGQIKRDSLVWKPGMENWEKASDVEELKEIVLCIPPAIPQN